MTSSTQYRLKEDPTGTHLEPVSAWQTPEFQKFALITLCTGLLLSLVGAFNLNADVNDLTKKKVPELQDRINALYQVF